MSPALMMCLLVVLLSACAGPWGFDRPNPTAQPNGPVASPTTPPFIVEPPLRTPPGRPTWTEPASVNPYAPQPDDDRLGRGNAYLDAVDVLVMESYPVQIGLSLRGSLPTPCHQLRVRVEAADAQNRIVVEVYSVAAADQVCIQVLQPFEANLNLGSYPPGHYSLWVNGEKVGEFDS